MVNAGEDLSDVQAVADDLAALLDAHGPLHHRDVESVGEAGPYRSKYASARTAVALWRSRSK